MRATSDLTRHAIVRSEEQLILRHVAGGMAAGAGFRFDARFGRVAAILAAVRFAAFGRSGHGAVAEVVGAFDWELVHRSTR
jgi:hypothetical protein